MNKCAPALLHWCSSIGSCSHFALRTAVSDVSRSTPNTTPAPLLLKPAMPPPIEAESHALVTLMLACSDPTTKPDGLIDLAVRLCSFDVAETAALLLEPLREDNIVITSRGERVHIRDVPASSSPRNNTFNQTHELFEHGGGVRTLLGQNCLHAASSANAATLVARIVDFCRAHAPAVADVVDIRDERFACTPLFYAARANATSAVSVLLELGASIDALSDHPNMQFSALGIACAYGSIDSLHVLLKIKQERAMMRAGVRAHRDETASADSSSCSWTGYRGILREAHCIAARYGRLEVLIWLAENHVGAPLKHRHATLVFRESFALGTEPVWMWLLGTYFAEPSARAALLKLPSDERLDKHWLARALGFAANNDQLDAVDWLVAHVDRLDFQQRAAHASLARSAFMLAASGNAVSVMRAFVDRGWIGSPHECDEDGDTAVRYAASHGALDALRLLIDEWGVAYLIPGYPWTVLHVAAMCDFDERAVAMLHYLMTLEGVPELHRVHDFETFRPIDLACIEGSLEFVRACTSLYNVPVRSRTGCPSLLEALCCGTVTKPATWSRMLPWLLDSFTWRPDELVRATRRAAFVDDDSSSGCAEGSEYGACTSSDDDEATTESEARNERLRAQAAQVLRSRMLVAGYSPT